MESVIEREELAMVRQPTASLRIRLLQTSYVLPWHLFVYAAGSSSETQLVFHSHTVRIEGSRLDALLEQVADRSLADIAEPSRTTRFTDLSNDSFQITGIWIAENE